MPSPFPGMDPYLEDGRLWPEFHRQLVTLLYQILLPALVDRYRVQVQQREYVTEEASRSSPVREVFIEIHRRSDGGLVTLIEVVSPANKTTPQGRKAYLDVRRQARGGNASAVEIDLVLQGQPMLDYSREGLPEWDYAVTVTRATQPERYEIYTTTLQKRLPRFKIPLAPDDRDTVLDLQSAFTRCYDQGDFCERIDYGREPTAPLSEKNRRWLAEWLWSRHPSEEQIAVAAYYLWEAEGRPHGRNKEHWYRAIEQLRKGKGAGPITGEAHK